MRVAAAASVVLLKNKDAILPLRRTDRNPLNKIAVIGPNAKDAMTSGGGSARLLSTYTVSPLEGIRNAVGEHVSVDYAVGVRAYKYPPLLDACIQQHGGGGAQGATVEFWNELPSEDFLGTKPNFGRPLRNGVWKTSTRSTECFFVDGIVCLCIFTLLMSLFIIFIKDEENIKLDCYTRVCAPYLRDHRTI